MSEAITTLDEAKQALAEMHRVVSSASRLTRRETVGILKRIYSIRLSDEDSRGLLDYIIASRKLEGANRAFLKKSDNPFVLPLRYVFPRSRDRCNVSRYAGALSELRAQNVPPEGLANAIHEKGGLCELYWRNRQRLTKKMVRNKINLDRNIMAKAGTPITLRLLPTASGIFKVLDATGGEAA